MPHITVLDQNTINKIAAGEVIERPASVVKELLENAIDAKATAVTVEIREGGISFIRVTDNGCGIPKEEVATAFLRHSTSKISSVEDLFTISSLGFRGEALSSIAAVAQVEVITKTSQGLTGVRYQIEGGAEKALEEVGAPEGTTFIARNLFYNTPVRRKFLKTAQTEGAHVADLVEKIALSHPEVSIRFIQNNQNKLHTSGNHNLKDIIYTVFGREIAANLLPIQAEGGPVKVKGFIGKPVIARSNRNYENYYINGRYIKSSIIAKAIEDAYKPFMMQHKYPFTLLHFEIQPDFLDVNVHPTKMELRFRDGEGMYRMVFTALQNALAHKELIPEVDLAAQDKRDALELRRQAEELRKKEHFVEPFERSRMESLRIRPKDAAQVQAETEAAGAAGRRFGAEKPYSLLGAVTAGRRPVSGTGNDESGSSATGSGFRPGTGITGGFSITEGFGGVREESGEYQSGKAPAERENVTEREKTAGTTTTENAGSAAALPAGETHPDAPSAGTLSPEKHLPAGETISRAETVSSGETSPQQTAEQLNLFGEKLLEPSSRLRHKLIGQLFDTYWLVEFDNQLFIIDQHAAHEKVLYERTMKSLKSREYTSQAVSPPIILTLSGNEQLLLEKYMDYFTRIGFEIEPFGGREYAVSGVPANLFSIAKKELLMEMIDQLSDDSSVTDPDMIYERVASMSCKAAVKGNHRMSAAEANELIDQLLTLENPYACPHGRPTIISMSKYELEKKFKRIV